MKNGWEHKMGKHELIATPDFFFPCFIRVLSVAIICRARVKLDKIGLYKRLHSGQDRQGSLGTRSQARRSLPHRTAVLCCLNLGRVDIPVRRVSP